MPDGRPIRVRVISFSRLLGRELLNGYPMTIAIYYGSTYGGTAAAADRIAARLEQRLRQCVSKYDVATSGLRDLERYDVLLLGCSTWNIGRLQPDWEEELACLRRHSFAGKRVALFGAGDQVTYPDTFVDALGILAEAVEARGAALNGRWPAAGYSHTASRAQRGSEFIGLALDYDYQEELNESRITRWTDQLLEELGLGDQRPAPLRVVIRVASGRPARRIAA